MTALPFCTCLPGATLWLDGVGEATVGELTRRLLDGHRRRVEVLTPTTSAVPGETPKAAAERIGLVAEILARHGILTLVVAPAGQPSDREHVRARHLRAGTTFLEAPTAGTDAPAPSADALLALLTEHGLVRTD
ncbi:hypothetical protein [Streptomyces sp. NPDC060198]|uniref:hypothetical protein n=1 Tax=Streptomyces sp. NPDC060198 TaxID=3347070 RepID=UPI003667373C